MQHADNLFKFFFKVKDLVREVIQFYKMKIEIQCTCHYGNKTNVPPLELHVAALPDLRVI